MKLDKKLMEKMEKDIGSFAGKIVDVSECPDTFSAHFDIDWAASQGVLRHELSVQVVENRIREVASNANLQVFSFVKDQVEKAPGFLEQLRPGRIILLK
jgi:hypothetical protein